MGRTTYKGKFQIITLIPIIFALLLFLVSLLMFIVTLSMKVLLVVVIFLIGLYIVFYNSLPRDIILDYKHLTLMTPFGGISKEINLNSVISIKVKYVQNKFSFIDLILPFLFGGFLNFTTKDRFLTLTIVDQEMLETRINSYSYRGFKHLVKSLYKIKQEVFNKKVEAMEM